jgi:hypothetical protein
MYRIEASAHAEIAREFGGKIVSVKGMLGLE